jgi:flagellar biosynthesis protein FliQ
MGFLKQEVPVIDFAEWSKGTRSEKIRPMAKHWAEVGFGTPVVLHLFYVVKIGLYILAAALFALATKGIDGWSNIGSWWTEPIVFQKVVLFTILFEVVGLGCGFGPLNNRFYPPLGSILYWLRPNTIRLPPWPKRIPFTDGDNRDQIDVALYGALLVVLIVGLVVSIFQAATQINEATLSFVPKVIASVAVLAVAGPWMMTTLVDYLRSILMAIPRAVI